jgi:hypothetical protein
MGQNLLCSSAACSRRVGLLAGVHAGWDPPQLYWRHLPSYPPCGQGWGSWHPRRLLYLRILFCFWLGSCPCQGSTSLPTAHVLQACQHLCMWAPIQVHAFSPLEVAHGAETLDLSLEQYLGRLGNAGLGSLPGTAAEILDDAVRAVLCPDKLTSQRWLEVMAPFLGNGKQQRVRTCGARGWPLRCLLVGVLRRWCQPRTGWGSGLPAPSCLAVLKRDPGEPASVQDLEGRDATVCFMHVWLGKDSNGRLVSMPASFPRTRSTWARHLVSLRDCQVSTKGLRAARRALLPSAHSSPLRALQVAAEMGAVGAQPVGISEFVPLPFVHMEAPVFVMGKARRGPTLHEAVLIHAVARLTLHPHIQNIQVRDTIWRRRQALHSQADGVLFGVD